MKFVVLASGSKGNCLAVVSGEFGILIDFGLSEVQTTRRLEKCNIDPGIFKAVLVSHSHKDHASSGIRRWVEKHGTPIYCTQETADRIPFLRDHPGIHRAIGIDGCFDLGPFWVMAFPLIHDTAGACSFVLVEDGPLAKHRKRLALLYETGVIRPEMADLCRDADALIIEANYDPKMAANGEKPTSILGHVAGGHLSNQQAADYLRTLTPRTKIVVSCHRSAADNNPELCRSTLQEALDSIGSTARLELAEQNEPTEVFEI